MSKNFEEEYKEYLNAQAPDIWNRIEAGVDAMGAATTQETADVESVVPIFAGRSKKAKKKRQIRYQHYRAIVSVAACLFALILIVPVYFLTRHSGKSSDSATSEAPMMLTDATIQNIEVASEESDDVIEESAPMEDAAGGITEIEVALEETKESTSDLAQVTEETTSSQLPGSDGNSGETTAQSEGEKGTAVASEEAAVTEGDDILSGVTEEESVAAQEDMQVTILGAGAMREDGIMYSAAVVGSASSVPIGLFVPAGSDIVLEVEKTYNVTAEISEDGSYYVVIAVTE